MKKDPDLNIERFPCTWGVGRASRFCVPLVPAESDQCQGQAIGHIVIHSQCFTSSLPGSMLSRKSLKSRARSRKGRYSFSQFLEPGLGLFFLHFHHPRVLGLPRVGSWSGSQQLCMHLFSDWSHPTLLLRMRMKDKGYPQGRPSPSQPNNYPGQVSSIITKQNKIIPNKKMYIWLYTPKRTTPKNWRQPEHCPVGSAMIV